MTAAYAAEVVTWRYPVPYDCYDMTDADPGFLAGPGSGFFALTDESGLIGFRSFVPDGQVPGGVYGDSALDTGGGLRPISPVKARAGKLSRAAWTSGGSSLPLQRSGSPSPPSTSGHSAWSRRWASATSAASALRLTAGATRS
jgi:hypothetical protein